MARGKKRQSNYEKHWQTMSTVADASTGYDGYSAYLIGRMIVHLRKYAEGDVNSMLKAQDAMNELVKVEVGA